MMLMITIEANQCICLLCKMHIIILMKQRSDKLKIVRTFKVFFNNFLKANKKRLCVCVCTCVHVYVFQYSLGPNLHFFFLAEAGKQSSHPPCGKAILSKGEEVERAWEHWKGAWRSSSPTLFSYTKDTEDQRGQLNCQGHTAVGETGKLTPAQRLFFTTYLFALRNRGAASLCLLLFSLSRSTGSLSSRAPYTLATTPATLLRMPKGHMKGWAVPCP